MGAQAPGRLEGKARRRLALDPSRKNARRAIPSVSVPDASVAPRSVPDAGRAEPNLTAPEDAGGAPTASSIQGSEQGAVNGTKTDPLKARAVDMYRAQLQAWFAARFAVRAKFHSKN